MPRRLSTRYSAITCNIAPCDPCSRSYLSRQYELCKRAGKLSGQRLLRRRQPCSTWAPATRLKQSMPGPTTFPLSPVPIPRLAFASVSAYLSMVDLTIQREIRRMPEAGYSRFAAITPDGKYLLKWNDTLRTLDVIDIAAFKIARRVELAGIMRNGSDFEVGSIVIVGNKAYVTTRHPSSTQPINRTGRSAHVPGASDRHSQLGSAGTGLCLPNAAATPDGKYVVMVQQRTTWCS